MANCGQVFNKKKHQTLTFLNSFLDVDPRNIGFVTVMELLELMEFMELMKFMELMEFMDGIYGIP